VIYVDRKGENSIVVDSGANAALVDLTDDELAEIAAADVLVLQLETPLSTVYEAVRAANAADTVVVLNAAPSGAMPLELLSAIDVLIVNEHEAAELAGEPAGTGERSLMSVLSSHGCDVIITLGAEGAFSGGWGTVPVKVPAFPVEATDTTGAGDAFVGAFAAAVDHAGDQRSLVAATEFATAAAALSVQRKGAVPSLPTLEEVREFLAAQ
jgi:ribokinase